ncbi:cation diffusion facilitator family transporter [Asanoa iriomotensis]|uniref:Cation transporter n=1 Tax=Asanoa iriomotensis TaxID=234613 RepID=A0ABQ4BYU5_9ACTN|nr:cation diffusion facilitator family transporter [Asanoa iriomotensis]GIF55698.1 cation transporter [Asanoa iriomotensis]
MAAPDTHQHGDHAHSGHEHRHSWWDRLRHLLTPHSHDAGDKVDDALQSSTEGIRALKISLIALGVTAVLQLLVVWISGSVALLADTVHNFADALTAVPLWFAFVIGRRLATRRYTYGYGRAEDLAGIVIVLVIAGSAALAGYESIRRLFEPREVNNVGWVLAAGIIGFAGNELVALYRIRVGRRIGSAALVADGLHARTDGLTSLAVVASAIGVALGFPLADPIIGLVICAAIVGVLVIAAKEIYHRLMDSVDPTLITRAEQVLADVPGVTAVDRVQMRWLGHRLHADVAIRADEHVSFTDAHDTADRARDALLADIPKMAGALVHVSPQHETRTLAPTGSAPAA